MEYKDTRYPLWNRCESDERGDIINKALSLTSVNNSNAQMNSEYLHESMVNNMLRADAPEFVRVGCNENNEHHEEYNSNTPESKR